MFGARWESGGEFEIIIEKCNLSVYIAAAAGAMGEQKQYTLTTFAIPKNCNHFWEMLQQCTSVPVHEGAGSSTCNWKPNWIWWQPIFKSASALRIARSRLQLCLVHGKKQKNWMTGWYLVMFKQSKIWTLTAYECVLLFVCASSSLDNE